MQITIQEELQIHLSQALTPHLKNFHSYRIIPTSNSIEVHCQVTEDEMTKILVLKIHILENHSYIAISNIFIPVSMRNKGIGKALIGNIHRIAKQYDFRTFVIELTPSFYERLRCRGAVVVTKGEAVQIVDETQLN